MTRETQLSSVPMPLPPTWRATPDAQTIVMRLPLPPPPGQRDHDRLARVPDHTPVPAELPGMPSTSARPQAERDNALPELPAAPTPKQRPSTEVFALIRRVALQRDLANAVGVLHHELGKLTGARVVLAVASEGRIWSPLPDDLRAAAPCVPLAAIDTCAQRRQPVLGARIAMLPIELAVPAVLVVYRTAEAPVFEPGVADIAAFVAPRLAMLDHYFAADAAKQHQAAADKASMFRPEALAASREDRRDGQLVGLTARWVKLAAPLVVVITAALVAAAALVQVPTYSRGTVVVTMNGTNVISSAAGRISKVLVVAGQHVSAGDPLIVLDTQKEQADYDQIDTTYRGVLSAFLFDTADESARQQLAGIIPQRANTQAALAAKTITAPCDGDVSAVLASDLVQAGEHVATIIPADSAPSVTAYMPGTDSSRFHKGMTIKFELPGYEGVHFDLEITDVGKEIMGAQTARKLIGQKLADAVQLPPSIVVVKARLPGASFESGGKTFNFSDGMEGIGEIQIESKSFLSVVIPTGD